MEDTRLPKGVMFGEMVGGAGCGGGQEKEWMGCLKKIQNAPRPSEHPPVKGKKRQNV